jgi:hypothetical protein
MSVRAQQLSLALVSAASRGAVVRRTQGAICAGGRRGSTRIARHELAARSRLARFPAVTSRAEAPRSNVPGRPAPVLRRSHCKPQSPRLPSSMQCLAHGNISTPALRVHRTPAREQRTIVRRELPSNSWAVAVADSDRLGRLREWRHECAVSLDRHRRHRRRLLSVRWRPREDPQREPSRRQGDRRSHRGIGRQPQVDSRRTR